MGWKESWFTGPLWTLCGNSVETARARNFTYILRTGYKHVRTLFEKQLPISTWCAHDKVAARYQEGHFPLQKFDPLKCTSGKKQNITVFSGRQCNKRNLQVLPSRIRSNNNQWCDFDKALLIAPYSAASLQIYVWLPNLHIATKKEHISATQNKI